MLLRRTPLLAHVIRGRAPQFGSFSGGGGKRGGKRWLLGQGVLFGSGRRAAGRATTVAARGDGGEDRYKDFNSARKGLLDLPLIAY